MKLRRQKLSGFERLFLLLHNMIVKKIYFDSGNSIEFQQTDVNEYCITLIDPKNGHKISSSVEELVEMRNTINQILNERLG